VWNVFIHGPLKTELSLCTHTCAGELDNTFCRKTLKGPEISVFATMNNPKSADMDDGLGAPSAERDDGVAKDDAEEGRAGVEAHSSFS